MPHPNDIPLLQTPLIDPGATALLEHQWRTPMTVIQSTAEVLRDCEDLTPNERNQLLDALLDEAARLHASLEDVLRGSRLMAEPHAAVPRQG